MNAISHRLRMAHLAAATALAAVAGAAPAAQEEGWMTVTTTVQDCTFTVTAIWQGYKGGNDVVDFGLSWVFPPMWDGLTLANRALVTPVKGKSGSATVTLTRDPSATLNGFRGTASMRDNKDVQIASFHISDVVFAYCDATPEIIP